MSKIKTRSSAYTPEDDARINALRLQGLTWDEIATQFSGKSGPTIRARAHRLRMECIPPPVVREPAPDRPARFYAGADPLPPGHPIALQILLEATGVAA